MSVSRITRYRWHAQPAMLGVAQAFSLAGKRIALLGADQRLAAAVSPRLVSAGAEVVVLSPTTSLTDASSIDGIIDFNVALVSAGRNCWCGPMQQTLALLKNVYPMWSEETDANRLFYVAVTRLGGRMGYDASAMAQPFGGLWAGLAKGLPREFPNCHVKVLDLDDAAWDQVDAILLDELRVWNLFEVGYQAGNRYTLVPQAIPLVDSDSESLALGTVVLSGGGRGIGFQIAKDLARTGRGRVIVTGREALWGSDQQTRWDSVDDLKKERINFLREQSAKHGVLKARMKWARTERLIDLHRNLREASRSGLPVEYVQCDVTDPADVRRLREQIPERVDTVIHNAGVDYPKRLPQKEIDTCLRTMSVKIDGFLNLLDEFGSSPDVFFCNVGSMTGRWGGMVGQMDYGAANDGLCRLGMWAAKQHGVTVKTLAWPTWERLGMVSNYEATLQYMDAMAVKTGVALWRAELADRTDGEVGFLGKIGRMISPVLLDGYPGAPTLPDIDSFVTMKFFLHAPQTYAPQKRFVTQVCFHKSIVPCLTDFCVDGKPAVPVAVLLEQSLHSAAWAWPRSRSALHLRCIQDLAIDMTRLVLAGDEARFVLDASLETASPNPMICCRVLTSDEREIVGRWTLVFGDGLNEPRPVEQRHGFGPPEIQSVRRSMTKSPGAGPRWRWQTLREAEVVANGRWANSVTAADLFAARYLPKVRLPINQLENVWDLASRTLETSAARVLCVDTMNVIDYTTNEPMQLLSSHGGDWQLLASSQNQMTLRRVRFEANFPSAAPSFEDDPDHTRATKIRP